MFHVGVKFALLRLIFCLRQKIKHPPAPLLLLFRKKSRSACLLGCKRPHNGLAVATHFLRVVRVQLPSPKSRNIFFIVLRHRKIRQPKGFRIFSFYVCYKKHPLVGCPFHNFGKNSFSLFSPCFSTAVFRLFCYCLLLILLAFR